MVMDFKDDKLKKSGHSTTLHLPENRINQPYSISPVLDSTGYQPQFYFRPLCISQILSIVSDLTSRLNYFVYSIREQDNSVWNKPRKKLLCPSSRTADGRTPSSATQLTAKYFCASLKLIYIIWLADFRRLFKISVILGVLWNCGYVLCNCTIELIFNKAWLKHARSMIF